MSTKNKCYYNVRYAKFYSYFSSSTHTHTHTQLNSSTANMSDASNGIQTLSLSFTHICHTFSTLFFSCIFAQCRINLTLYNATLQSVFTIAAPATATAEKKITLFIMYDFQWIQTGTAFPSKRFSRKETQIDSILKCVFFLSFSIDIVFHFVAHFKDIFQYAVNSHDTQSTYSIK